MGVYVDVEVNVDILEKVEQVTNLAPPLSETVCL